MIDETILCIECNSPLKKLSEDTIFCTTETCSRRGYVTAIAKCCWSGNEKEIRTGEPVTGPAE